MRNSRKLIISNNQFAYCGYFTGPLFGGFLFIKKKTQWTFTTLPHEKYLALQLSKSETNCQEVFLSLLQS